MASIDATTQPQQTSRRGANDPLRFLVTGGAGFIGSRLVQQLMTDYPDSLIAVVDSLTYAAASGARLYFAFDNLLAQRCPPELFAVLPRTGVDYTACDAEEGTEAIYEEVLRSCSRGSRIVGFDCDIGATPAEVLAAVFDAVRPDVIYHLAAETHVDRSLDDKHGQFVTTNVLGTQKLLRAAHNEYEAKRSRQDPRLADFRFVYVSTDEVYGPVPLADEALMEYEDPAIVGFRETNCTNPSNPYAASKLGAEALVRSFHVSHGLPIVITRGANTFGPRQFPEKFLPRMIAFAVRDEPVPLYGDGLHRREWLHVDDHVEAIDFVRRRGSIGETYNVGNGVSRSNRWLAGAVLEILGKPTTLVCYVEDRPGHDREYCMNVSKLAELGWSAKHTFDEDNLGALAETVLWYVSDEGRSWYAHVGGQATTQRHGLS